MSIIKSALEIALERTRDVEGNKEALEASSFTNEGKRAVSKFMSAEADSLKEPLAKYQKKQLAWVREGAYQALMANLKLPVDEMAFKQSKRAAEGLFALVSDPKRLTKHLGQMEHFFEEYLEERKRITTAVERQYAPRLRQKEEEMSHKMGAAVKIDPHSDPEFVKLLKQNLVLLEDRYAAVLEQVKGELKKMVFEG